jgi:putative flippase GtrA
MNDHAAPRGRFDRATLWLEGSRFLVVGAANFALTMAVFTVMLKVLGIHHLPSLFAAWVVGVLFSYVLNFTWVFKPEEQMRFRARFVRFVLASLTSVLLNMAILEVLVRQTGFDPFWLQLALIPFVVLFNFATAKLWSLRQGDAS